MDIRFRILDPLRLVDVVKEIKCSRCKKVYFPNDTDISLNGSLYYKQCKSCREKGVNFLHKHINKKNKN